MKIADSRAYSLFETVPGCRAFSDIVLKYSYCLCWYKNVKCHQSFVIMASFVSEKIFMQISWLCISNSSQGLTPLGGMRCSLNIPGNRYRKVNKAALEWNGKTATSDDYIFNHFQDTTLLCSLTFHKQESREMPYTNLTGLILKNLRGGTLNLFSLWRGKHTVSTEGGVGWGLSVLREGWKAECY